MYRTYERKLILTKSDEKRLLSWIGVCRLVYNLGLEISIDSYRKTSKRVNKFELMKQVTALRSDIDWVMDVPGQSLCKAIQRLDKGYELFFKTYKKGGGFPKFASKRTYKSICFTSDVKLKNGIVRIPKIGNLKFKKDSCIYGDIKSVTIKVKPKGIFALVACTNVPSKFTSENQAVGLDMGIASFCTDSKGGQIVNPRHFAKYERKLRIENRSLARKKKGSASWTKQAKRLSLLQHKIGSIRKDFLQKESTKIAKANSVVFIEDLNVAGLAKNNNLSKHILDAGWGMFRIMLSYKTNVVAVNPAYTSQTCFSCGEVDKKSRISQSEYVCTSCGHIDHADVNAAKNIKHQGTMQVRQREALACA